MSNILNMIATIVRRFLDRQNLISEETEMEWTAVLPQDGARYFGYRGSNLDSQTPVIELNSPFVSSAIIVLVSVCNGQVKIQDVRPMRVIHTTGGTFVFSPDEEVIFDEAHRQK